MTKTDRRRLTPSAARRESRKARKARTEELLGRLKEEYPNSHCALEHESPLQLLVATILSAQCTDKRVNMVTPDLFARYPTATDYAEADIGELEEMVRTTGFFRNKAKSLRGLGQALVDEHGGEVPSEMAALVKLPGTGRKTANVVLGNAFDINVGVVVDTHVGRLSGRMALTENKDPKKIEQDLMPLFPRKNWCMLSHLLIHHGRALCPARNPKCDKCEVKKNCPQVGVG